MSTAHRRQRPWAAWIGLVLGVACGGSSADLMNSTSGDPVDVPPWACVPGETQPCDCSAELEGLQTCAADGSGFGECDCSPGAMSQGPPPTSTGTGTGTETGTETGTAGTADSGSSGDPTTGMGPGSSGDPTTSGGSTGGSSSTG